MKRILLFLMIYFIGTSVFAQSPELMSYQSVIRNAAGALIANQPVGMRISILQTTGLGTPVPVYVETQTPTTNQNGLSTIKIGAGTIVSGNISTINWNNGPYFLQTETDPTGGTAYSISFIGQMLSVPYALYAKNSGGSNTGWNIQGNTATDADFIGTTNDKPLIFKDDWKKVLEPSHIKYQISIMTDAAVPVVKDF